MMSMAFLSWTPSLNCRVGCSSTTRANTWTRALATMLRYFPRSYQTRRVVFVHSRTQPTSACGRVKQAEDEVRVRKNTVVQQLGNGA